MNKLNYSIMRSAIAFTLFAVISTIFCCPCCASEQPQFGNRYKVIGPLYLTGVYRDLNNRQLSLAHLSPVQSSGPEVAFQREVPMGTIMTIIGPAPKRVPLPFFARRYFVSLEPASLPREIDVIVELYRGIEGNLDGLNPELFSRP
jgi:hypothetical protein